MTYFSSVRFSLFV